MRSNESEKSENRIFQCDRKLFDFPGENQKVDHTPNKVTLTNLKNTKNLLLISQRMHQNKKTPCVSTF